MYCKKASLVNDKEERIRRLEMERREIIRPVVRCNIKKRGIFRPPSFSCSDTFGNSFARENGNACVNDA